MTETLNVLVFTCEGREHLLQKMWESFAPRLEGINHRCILAIDGQVSPEAVTCIQPDVVVQNYRRRGYIRSVLNAIAIVDSELFLWLEDDWQITGEFDLEQAVAVLVDNPRWVQVRWSKMPTLERADHQLIPGIHLSSVGFSANPCMCRTALVREGFKYLIDSPKGNSLDVDFFEHVLTRWAGSRDLLCAVFDPRGKVAVTHLGFLESTGRQWLMTSSLERVPIEHFFNMGAPPPPLWRRLWMAFKLLRATLRVILRIFGSCAAYELAFRFIATTKVTLSSEHVAKSRAVKCRSEGR
ncbi:MAG: hypothetical protein ABSG54_14960 [Terriglobia bacterium]|jgi:hypothetical protein